MARYLVTIVADDEPALERAFAAARIDIGVSRVKRSCSSGNSAEVDGYEMHIAVLAEDV